jgi:hypothetical protein
MKLAASLFALALIGANAEASAWRFDFTSPRGYGFFEVDSTTFVVPSSAASPTAFVVTAADINITAAGLPLSGPVHYTLSNLFETSCGPGECRATFRIAPIILLGFGTYDALFLQLNFERIWVPWISNDQQTVQMWQHTAPYINDWAWNDVARAQRTVLDWSIARTAPSINSIANDGSWAVGFSDVAESAQER